MGGGGQNEGLISLRRDAAAASRSSGDFLKMSQNKSVLVGDFLKHFISSKLGTCITFSTLFLLPPSNSSTLKNSFIKRSLDW